MLWNVRLERLLTGWLWMSSLNYSYSISIIARKRNFNNTYNNFLDITPSHCCITDTCWALDKENNSLKRNVCSSPPSRVDKILQSMGKKISSGNAWMAPMVRMPEKSTLRAQTHNIRVQGNRSLFHLVFKTEESSHQEPDVVKSAQFSKIGHLLVR